MQLLGLFLRGFLFFSFYLYSFPSRIVTISIFDITFRLDRIENYMLLFGGIGNENGIKHLFHIHRTHLVKIFSSKSTYIFQHMSMSVERYAFLMAIHLHTLLCRLYTYYRHI